MSAAMQNDGPRDTGELSKLIDRALLRVRPRLHSWVEQRMPAAEGAELITRVTCGEFAAKVKDGVWEPGVLAPADETLGLLCGIAGQRIADRAIARHRPRLYGWIRKRMPDAES